MRLLLIIGMTIVAIAAVAAVFLFLLPYILGFIVLVLALGAAGRLLGFAPAPEGGAEPPLPDSRE